MTLDEAKEFLKNWIEPDGDLIIPITSLYYYPGNKYANFTLKEISADQLEAIAVYMREMSK